MIRLAVFGLALVATLALGTVATRLTVTSGVGGYDGAERALAQEALSVSRFATDNPLVASAVVARRVVSVERERPGDCTELGFAAHGAYPGHKADVVGYPLFRVPVVRVAVTCGGTVWGTRYGSDT